MVGTQIQLAREQAAALKRLAGERGVSAAQSVRQSVDALIRESQGLSW